MYVSICKFVEDLLASSNHWLVFLVQIPQNFGKYIPMFVFMAKKNLVTRFEVFGQGKNHNIGGGRVLWQGKRKIRE
jgi:hypothetical protein